MVKNNNIVKNQDLRFSLEALIACQGSCTGCNIDKKNSTIDGYWDKDKFEKIVDRLLPYMDEYIKKTEGDFNTKVFFTQGDYFLLKEEQIDELFDIVSKIYKNRLPGKSNVISFTLSALYNKKTLDKKVNIILKNLEKHNLDIFPEVVFDLAKIKHRHYWDSYIENINYILEVFPCAAINIQVGHDTFENDITQKDLLDFFNYSKIERFEFILTPTIASASKLYNIEYIINWLGDFYLLWLKEGKKGYSFPYIISEKYKNVKGISEIDMQNIYHIINHISDNSSLYVDFNGKLSNFKTGISNIYPISYAGYKGIDLLNDEKHYDFAELIKRNYMFLNKEQLKYKACQTCSYKYLCLLTDGVLLNRTVNAYQFNHEKCNVGLKKYYDYILSGENYETCGLEYHDTYDTSYKNKEKKIIYLKPINHKD